MPDYPIAAPPRVSPDVFHRALTRALSPAAAENLGGELYRVCVDRGVDPAIALAFFAHESSYGRAGLATTTKNWGNLRRSPTGRGVVREIPGRGPFAHYLTWADSLHDFCVLLRGPIYEGRGRRTVSQVVPVYAPAGDGNAPLHYINRVNGMVEAWARASDLAGWSPAVVDAWARWGEAFPLPIEQRAFAIPRAWRDAPWLGEAQSEELVRGPAGRKVAWRLFAGGWVCWEEYGDRITLGRRWEVPQ